MGITTRSQDYELEGEPYDLFLAVPKGQGPHPAVLVCHAWGGRTRLMEEVARRLARLGYVGAAIDLYGVDKRGHDNKSSEALMMPLVREPARLRARLRAAFEQARALDEVDASRLAVIGYCFGGSCAILCARMGLPLRAAVSFHGLLAIGERVEGPVHGPILVLHGQDDPMVSSEQLAAFSDEMKRLRAEWHFHVYPGVMHSFTNPKADDPELGTLYDADADRRSWAEARRFLARALAS
jgi:dienelactone hydrolase